MRFHSYIRFREGRFAHTWAGNKVGRDDAYQLGIMADYIEDNPSPEDVPPFLAKIGGVLEEFMEELNQYRHLESDLDLDRAGYEENLASALYHLQRRLQGERPWDGGLTNYDLRSFLMEWHKLVALIESTIEMIGREDSDYFRHWDEYPEKNQAQQAEGLIRWLVSLQKFLLDTEPDLRRVLAHGTQKRATPAYMNTPAMAGVKALWEKP
jgi:hypothetical protein